MNAIWTQTETGFATEASDIAAAGGSRKVTFPGSMIRVGDLKWQEVRDDREGEITSWQREFGGQVFIIFND